MRLYAHRMWIRVVTIGSSAGAIRSYTVFHKLTPLMMAAGFLIYII